MLLVACRAGSRYGANPKFIRSAKAGSLVLLFRQAQGFGGRKAWLLIVFVFLSTNYLKRTYHFCVRGKRKIRFRKRIILKSESIAAPITPTQIDLSAVK